MKLKRKIGIGLALSATVYFALAYNFMWWPVVTYQSDGTDACVNNLRQFDAAVNQFAFEHNKQAGDEVVFKDITPYVKLTASGEPPTCPAGGKYSVSVIGADPTCSLGTNPLVKVHGRGLTWHYDHAKGSTHRLPHP